MVESHRRLSSYPDIPHGFALSEPVSDRLDAFVQLVADAGGGRTSRRELVAALIATATAVGERLSAMLRQYRILEVDDIEVPLREDQAADDT